MANLDKIMAFMRRYTASVGGTSAPGYAPQRDITNLGAIAMEEGLEDIMAQEPPKFITDWMSAFGISREALIDAYLKFLKMQRIVGPSRYPTVADGARDSGYGDVPLEVKALVDAIFGRAMLAAYWYGIRDVTVLGEEPPTWTQYNRIENLFKELFNAMEGDESPRGKKLKEELFDGESN